MYVPLPIGLVCKLEPALVAHEGLDPAVGAHVGVQETLPEVGLATERALERPGADPLVLPGVVVKVALGHKGLLANITRVRLLSVVLDADVLGNTCLVEHLAADRALGVQRALLVLWHEADLMLHTDVSGQAGTVDEDVSTEVAFLGLLVVLTFLVPVEVALGLEHLPAVAEELLLGLHRPVLLMDPFVLREVAVTLE